MGESRLISNRKKNGSARGRRRLLAVFLGCAAGMLSAPQWLGAQGSAPSTALRVAAASDLQPLLPEILKDFEAETGIRAEATYQASAALTIQIENGAPFDVFLSADLGYPKRLMDKQVADVARVNEAKAAASGRVASDKGPLRYGRGALVLWTRKDSRFNPPTLETLRDPLLGKLAVANPERAPYGRAAMALIDSLGLRQALTPKLVTGENIAQAAQFAASGNADAGLISLTSAMSPPLAAAGSYFRIPAAMYAPIDQGAVIVSSTRQHGNAERFLQFLISGKAQRRLAAGGLDAVK